MAVRSAPSQPRSTHSDCPIWLSLLPEAPSWGPVVGRVSRMCVPMRAPCPLGTTDNSALSSQVDQNALVREIILEGCIFVLFLELPLHLVTQHCRRHLQHKGPVAKHVVVPVPLAGCVTWSVAPVLCVGRALTFSVPKVSCGCGSARHLPQPAFRIRAAFLQGAEQR